MSMTSLGTTGLLVVLLVGGCAAAEPEVPPTGVDLTTPVEELAGWDELIADLVLPYNRDQALAQFVRVFRDGLDISRLIADPEERRLAEADWWAQTALSLETTVGPDQVAIVIAWLESVFGRRDGSSS